MTDNENKKGITPAEIKNIVKSIIEAQSESAAPKISTPKVEIPKLTVSNYADWSKKMMYSLKLHNLWVDPTKDATTFTGSNKAINEKAALYMACYLDDANAALINDTNEKSFVDAWNEIEKFHRPRTATVLADIYSIIFELVHQDGESIENHLMQIETQFARLQDIKKPLSEDHKVAIILASVKKSHNFSSVFESALWEDESALTIAKVKSVLITSQRNRRIDSQNQAHQSKTWTSSKAQKFPTAAAKHSRRPKNPQSGWRCRHCEMDNHSWADCRNNKNSSNQQRYSKNARAANLASGDVDVGPAPQFENAHAYSSYETNNQTSMNWRFSRRRSPYQSSLVSRELQDSSNSSTSSHLSDSMRKRLGEQSATQPQEPASPVALATSYSFSDDLLDHEFSPNYELSSGNYFQIRNSQSQIHSNHFQNKLPGTEMHDQRFNMKFTNELCDNVNQVNLHEENKQKMNSKNESQWIIDSGATIHVTKDRNCLSNFVPSHDHNIIISDGRVIPISGHGTMKLMLRNTNEKSFQTLFLNNVAYVPGFAVNLISVRALTQLNFTLKFMQDKCFIINGSTVALLAKLKNSAYVLRVKNTSFNQSSENANFCIHQWHRMMSHRNLSHIKQVKDVLKIKFSKCNINCSNECEGCLKGKFSALPFPQKSEKPENPLDVITTDICGPFRTESIGGSKYFVTFTDANTDYTEIVTLRAKSDCQDELIRFIQRCMTYFGTPPRIIRSDQGKEYLDRKVQNFLKDNGISFQCSVANCHEQNGIAERKNRTLLEAVRTLLMSKQLPKYLWAEALHHANSTFNAIPKINEKQSPQERFFKKKINFRFIEFGSPVYCMTNAHNRSKLEARAEPGIFVGHDKQSKGFRVFLNGKLTVHRHLKFLSSGELRNQLSSCEESQENSSDNESSELRRSERIKQKQAHSIDELYEPKTYNQAMKCPDKINWILAMEEELRSIEDNKTWSLVDLPKGREAIGCRWVFKIKQNGVSGKLTYKARLVAKGFTQKFGVDYDEVFAPVVHFATVRTLLAVASARKLLVKQYDVKTAFLNGTLKEEIFMKLPPGSPNQDKIVKLHKSLYGLKQAARVWSQTLQESLNKLGFNQSKHDECLYIMKQGSDVCYAIVHVDDMLFAASKEETITIATKSLSKCFELKCLGDVQHYLGIEVIRNEKFHFSIAQTQYIMKIAKEFQLDNSKGSKYPIDPGYHKLVDDDMLDCNNEFRKVIGMLLYVSNNTRPDISASVSILAQRVEKPRSLDFTEALRIVRYLVSTKDLKLNLYDDTESIHLRGFSDSD
jgi:Reverse transcriptase (RNA-dependent DNA polymerase)/gag-polypeptide of LTR copia-type/Integrase core domain